MEYRETATKTFVFLQENQYQIARKLSARKFQGLFIEHNLITLGAGVVNLLAGNHKQRFEIHCNQIESWSTENLKFVFVFSVIGRNCPGNVSKRCGII